jgi:hypothetical protein
MIPPFTPMDLHDMEELIPGNDLADISGNNADMCRHDRDEIEEIRRMTGLIPAPFGAV